MLMFSKTHLYPLWKLHSDTCKNEKESPLWYAQVGPESERSACASNMSIELGELTVSCR